MSGSTRRATDVQAGTSFPKPGPKLAASVDRFVAAAVGSNRRSDGPFFVLGLADFVNGEHDRLAPTYNALRALSDLIDCGLNPRLPQPAAATQRWWSFLASAAPVEQAAWKKVLQVINHMPDRNQLVSHFPEWPGQTASTNTIGFVSRSREWGLVEPKLVDGRYQLTDLGAAIAQEG